MNRIMMIQLPDGTWLNSVHIACFGVNGNQLHIIISDGYDRTITFKDEEEAIYYRDKYADEINSQFKKE